jgi:hypothetical protein
VVATSDEPLLAIQARVHAANALADQMGAAHATATPPANAHGAGS